MSGDRVKNMELWTDRWVSCIRLARVDAPCICGYCIQSTDSELQKYFSSLPFVFYEDVTITIPSGEM